MTSAAARAQFATLHRKHGELSTTEEALISPVGVCMFVLKLPSGGQLGYRGSVINFTLDVGKVRTRAFILYIQMLYAHHCYPHHVAFGFLVLQVAEQVPRASVDCAPVLSTTKVAMDMP